MAANNDFQKHLYDVAFEIYQYVHSDVWRGQKYYTTLNTAISTIGFGLVTALIQSSSTPKVAYAAAIIVFIIGVFIALIAFFTIKTLRENFMQAVWFKTVIEEGLKDDLRTIQEKAVKPELVKPDEIGEKWRLTPVYSLSDEDLTKLLYQKKNWMQSHIFNRGVTLYFMLLQIAFALVNIGGIVLATYLATYSTNSFFFI